MGNGRNTSVLTVRNGTKMLLVFFTATVHVLYLCERGPMGGAPYTGPRLGDGPIIEVSVSQIDAKERPSKLPVGSP